MKRMGAPAVLACMYTVCGAAPAWGSPFAAAKVVSNFGASGTAAADLDGDGAEELVDAVSSGDGRRLRIYRWNTGLLTFEYFNVLDVVKRADRFGGDLELADIDGDGWADIVVPDSSNSTSKSGALTWFKNPGGQIANTWKESLITKWSGSGTGEEVHHLSDIVAGDINVDGLMDIVVRDIDHGFWVVLQSAAGTWSPKRFVATGPREGLELFNPDRDADLDILLNGVWFETPSNPQKGIYTKREIKGAQAWYPSGQSEAEIDNYASKVVAADFNSDGRDDVLITNAEELAVGRTPSKPKGISLFLAPNNPIDDTWKEIKVFPDYYGWHTAEVADIDFDGDLDLVSGTAWNAKVTAVFYNQGNGASFISELIASNTIYQGQLADFDGDGDLDLWGPPQFNAGDVLYWENTSATDDAGGPEPDDETSDGTLPPTTGTVGETSPPPDTGGQGDDSISNLALGIEPIVSSGSVGLQLTDGKFSDDSRWFANAGYPQWVDISLDDEYWLTGASFYQQTPRASSYFVEVRSAGTWEVAGAGYAAGSAEIHVDFPEPIWGDRVKFTIDDGTLYLKVFELEVYGSRSPATTESENIAIGKVVSASSGVGAPLLTDGRVTTDSRWVSEFGFPQSVVVELDQPYLVTRASLLQFAPRVDTYRWSVWSDGRWIAVATGTASQQLNVEGSFPAVRTDRVLFEALSGSYSIKAYELEIWGLP